MVAESPRRGHPFLARRLQDEPDYRDRVEAAERLGIPPSRLDGREPATVTRHYYAQGKLVRSVTTREPEWTEQDRAEILALTYRRAHLCPDGCGYWFSDTTSHEETGPVFRAHHTVCRARLASLEYQKANESKDVVGQARLYSVTMRKR